MPEELMSPIEQPAVTSEQPSVAERVPKRPRVIERPATARAPVPVQPPVPVAAQPGAAKSAESGISLQTIENVLSNDLEEAYFQLPPAQQAAFKQKGEETARTIKAMIDSAKVNAKKIAQLIMDWLKLIPGVNKYFLEQESKIKTDEILGLKQMATD